LKIDFTEGIERLSTWVENNFAAIIGGFVNYCSTGFEGICAGKTVYQKLAAKIN
jgi:hypothetical protein